MITIDDKIEVIKILEAFYIGDRQYTHVMGLKVFSQFNIHEIFIETGRNFTLLKPYQLCKRNKFRFTHRKVKRNETSSRQG